MMKQNALLVGLRPDKPRGLSVPAAAQVDQRDRELLDALRAAGMDIRAHFLTDQHGRRWLAERAIVKG